MNQKYLFIIPLLFLLGSCAQLRYLFGEREKVPFDDYQRFPKEHQVSHLKAWKNFYLSSPEIKEIKLSVSSRKYIQDLFLRIISKNELLVGKEEQIDLRIVNDSRPFYFSLPGQNFFLSLGLIKKYLRHEGYLASILAFEAMRSHNLIYPQVELIPKGFISTPKILGLLRISAITKTEIHKWSYSMLKRSSFDSDLYLSWIQVQNTNNLDFVLHLGDSRSISQEESLFKEFLIKNYGVNNLNLLEGRSSDRFYRFIDELKGLNYET